MTTIAIGLIVFFSTGVEYEVFNPNFNEKIRKANTDSLVYDYTKHKLKNIDSLESVKNDYIGSLHKKLDSVIKENKRLKKHKVSVKDTVYIKKDTTRKEIVFIKILKLADNDTIYEKK